MIIKRLKYLAVCLLVLLNVMSTMGGSNDDYKYYNSQLNSSLCLSFKNNRLTDCCKQDDMQRIYVHKTGPATGFYHIKDYKKVLCYDETRRKFRLYRRKSLQLCQHRHQRRRERRPRRRRRLDAGCKLSQKDEENLKRNGCELHETLGFGFTYISFDENSRYLGLRRGRVQKHRRLRGGGWREPKSNGQRFMAMSESSFHKITSNHNLCRA